MTIYVPAHLRKLGIFKNLCDMVQAYISEFEPPEEESTLRIDPVLEFIRICLPGSSPEVQNYLVRMFYSVKGTMKVIEYAEIFLELGFEGEVIYTTRTLSFVLPSIKGSDAAVFDSSLREFLGSLLYFEDLVYQVRDLEVTVEEELPVYVGPKIIKYKKYEL